MCLVSKNWWIGEIERNERKLRGQVEGREEEWKRAKLPPPVSLYTVLSLFFGWLFVWLSSWRKNLCWISKFATGFQKFHFCMRSNDFTIHNCIFLSETSQELDQVNSANLLFKFSSFARGRSIRMTICKRPVHPDDHLQEPVNPDDICCCCCFCCYCFCCCCFFLDKKKNREGNGGKHLEKENFWWRQPTDRTSIVQSAFLNVGK